MKHCDIQQFKGLSDRLRIISTLTWQQLKNEPHDKYGYEALSKEIFNASFPEFAANDDVIIVFRFGGGRHGGRIAGVRRDNVFHVLFIDRDFTLYNHGS